LHCRLKRINQNLAILIDSDREKRRQHLNPTKIRIRNEFDKGPGFAWITSGREIENYIRPEQMIRTLSSIYSNVHKLLSNDRYNKIYHYMKKNGTIIDNKIDKVKIAKLIASQPADLDVEDLRVKVRQTSKFIRKCNDLPSSEF